MRLSILLTISVLLSACGLLGKKPEPFVPAKTVAVSTYVYADCGKPPQRSPVEFRPITWRILPDAKGEQRFTLTAKGYEDLSFNQSETEKGSKELKAEIQYYLDCLTRPIEVPQP